MRANSVFTTVILAAVFMMNSFAAAAQSHPGTGMAVKNNHQLPPLTLDSGGPDAYGYYYIDSEDNALNAPEYNWIDISGIGVDMGIIYDDQNVGPFPIGFTFNYYGVDFISFRACSNGWASFSSTSNSLSNVTIPSTSEPNDLLAVFWDDLHPHTTGHAYYYSNNVDTLIIAWHDFERFSGPGVYTFEIILTADGNIVYQYQSVTETLDSHTVGIENGSGTVGLQYVYNELRDESGTAILFTLEEPDYGYPDVVVIAADDASIFLGELSGMIDIGNVVYFDARTSTPILSYLQNFDVAVVWSNYQFYDRIAMGNVLADYLDAGGGVVLGQFCFGSGWELQGRVMTEYSPYTSGAISFSTRNLGINDAGHQLMRGVNALGDIYSSNVSLQNSPRVVAQYADGTPLAAYNPTMGLVAINGYVGDTRQFTGDMIALYHNAIYMAMEGAPEILLLCADDGPQITRPELKSYADISSVHCYYPQSATPTLDFLQQYEVVVVWSNYPFDDAQMTGNRLADYVDSGGKVVMHMFCFGTGWELQGRLMNSYSPFGAGAAFYETRTLGWHNSAHPLMAGVSDVTDYYAAQVTLENNGETVASWDDSTPFVAYNPDHDVVGINGYIGDYRDFTGDMMTITHNAINFLRYPTAVDDEIVGLPRSVSLTQNYPNPFNAATIIKFNLPVKTDVNLEVFNILGQRVAVLAEGTMDAGHHAVTFDASNLGSGMYFYRLDAGEYSDTRKMTVLK